MWGQSQSAAQNVRPNVEELESRAAEQRERVSRDVAALQQDVRREFDVRARLQDGIHTHPRGFYGAAAGAALFTGYVLARILKA
jgi:Flp pilus assembly protein TadB